MKLINMTSISAQKDRMKYKPTRINGSGSLTTANLTIRSILLQVARFIFDIRKPGRVGKRLYHLPTRNPAPIGGRAKRRLPILSGLLNSQQPSGKQGLHVSTRIRNDMNIDGFLPHLINNPIHA